MSASDGPDAPYWASLAKGRLELPRCGGCGRWTWPAVDRCGECGSAHIEWIEREMRGTIFSWTRTWHRFALTESIDLPFVTIVCEIADCGVRLMGRLADPDRVDPVIGEKVAGKPGVTRVLDRDIPTILWERQA